MSFYAFWIPYKVHFTIVGSSLPWLMWAQVGQRKILRLLRSGGFHDQISYGALKFKADEGLLLIRYAIVVTTSAQNCFEKFTLNNMHITFSIKVIFIFSTSPFYYGVCPTVLCLAMPFALQNSSKSLLQFSKPLSVLNLFILLSFWFSMSAIHSLNFSKLHFFCFNM